jgi:hypothetical protein
MISTVHGRPQTCPDHKIVDRAGWASGHIHVEDTDSWLSPARLDEQAVHRLSRPVVLLAALYHPENFPLPRFPLGISDVARAARATLLKCWSSASAACWTRRSGSCASASPAPSQT